MRCPIICELMSSFYPRGLEQDDLANNWTSRDLALNRDSSYALADYISLGKDYPLSMKPEYELPDAAQPRKITGITRYDNDVLIHPRYRSRNFSFSILRTLFLLMQ